MNAKKAAKKKRSPRAAKKSKAPNPAGPVSAQLFDAIQDAIRAGWSVNRIALGAGVPQSTLQEWCDGTTEQLKQQTSNALCDWLGMRLTDATIPPLEEAK